MDRYSVIGWQTPKWHNELAIVNDVHPNERLSSSKYAVTVDVSNGPLVNNNDPVRGDESIISFDRVESR